MSEKVKVQDFTLKAILIGVIIGIVSMVVNSVGCEISGGTNQQYWMPRPELSAFGSPQAAPFIYTFGAITFIIFVIAIINQIAKKPVFTKAETAVVTVLSLAFIFMKTAGASASWWVGIVDQFYILTTDPYIWGTRYRDIFEVLPSFFQPRDTAYIDRFINAGAPIDWMLFMPQVAYSILFVLSIFLFGAFTALLMRTLWIDVESLPFPAATYHVWMVDSVQPDATGRVEFFKNKYFLGGFIACFLWLFIANLKFIYIPGWSWESSAIKYASGQWGDFHEVWEPGTLPWRDAPYIYPALNLSTAAPALGLPYAPLVLVFTPWLISWGFLNTIPNLIGCVLAGIIMVLLPPILAMIGVFPPRTTQHWAWFDQHTSNNLWGEPGDYAVGFWGILFATGGLLAYVFYPLWRNRSRFAPMIKALYTKIDPKIDEESPLPYRYIWIGIIVFFILMLIVGIVANVSALAWTIYIVSITLLLGFGAAKLVAETGGYWGAIDIEFWTGSYIWNFFGLIAIYFTGTYGTLNSTNFMTVNFLTYTYLLVFATVVVLMLRGSYMTLHGFKVAATENVNKKKLLLWSLVVIIVGVITSAFVDVWFLHALKMKGPWEWINWYGLDTPYETLSNKAQINSYMSTSTFEIAFGPKLGNTIAYFVIGIVVVLLLKILGERYRRFSIGAAGVLLGVLAGPGLWTAWLVALILKWLVIRVGGMRMYVDKAQPLFIGCLFGFFLACFIADTANVILGYQIAFAKYM